MFIGAYLISIRIKVVVYEPTYEIDAFLIIFGTRTNKLWLRNKCIWDEKLVLLVGTGKN